MEIDYLITVILSAISGSAILLIATIGLAVVFGLMGVINLAHGQFIMIGAYASLTVTKIIAPFLTDTLGFNATNIAFLLSIPVAVMITMIIGALVEILIIKWLYGRIFDTMLATWGLSIAFYQIAILTFGTVTPGIGLPQYTFKIGSFNQSIYPILMIIVAAVMVYFVYYLMTRTVYGMKARAAIQVPEMAQAIGIESSRVNTLTFAVGCGLAGFAGAILLPLFPATPETGFWYAVKAFLIVVVAGPVTLTGSVLAALGLSGGASITASLITSVAGDIFFFFVTAIFLWLYPLGISANWRRKM